MRADGVSAHATCLRDGLRQAQQGLGEAFTPDAREAWTASARPSRLWAHRLL